MKTEEQRGKEHFFPSVCCLLALHFEGKLNYIKLRALAPLYSLWWWGFLLPIMGKSLWHTSLQLWSHLSSFFALTESGEKRISFYIDQHPHEAMSFIHATLSSQGREKSIRENFMNNWNFWVIVRSSNDWDKVRAKTQRPENSWFV